MFETIQVSNNTGGVILHNCESFSCCSRIAIGSDATFLTVYLLHLLPVVTVALSSTIEMTVLFYVFVHTQAPYYGIVRACELLHEAKQERRAAVAVGLDAAQAQMVIGVRRA